jgi:hypothetical protein
MSQSTRRFGTISGSLPSNNTNVHKRSAAIYHDINEYTDATLEGTIKGSKMLLNFITFIF